MDVGMYVKSTLLAKRLFRFWSYIQISDTDCDSDGLGFPDKFMLRVL